MVRSFHYTKLPGRYLKRTAFSLILFLSMLTTYTFAEEMMREPVSTDKAPGQIGPYSQGMKARGTLVFTAGQIPLNAETGEIVGTDITGQTHQALKNLKAVLEAAGTGMEHVVKTTVFLKDMDDFVTMNEVYVTYFPSPPPARSAVEVARLPKDVLVEIECIALVP